MRILATLLCSVCLLAGAEEPLLLQQPAISKTHIVFVYAGDLWSVPRAGGEAIRLTSGKGVEQVPYFSPDGKTVAFSADYDGNIDVFTVPASGGVPKRLTSHPAPDVAAGWTPDGKRILFISPRETYQAASMMYSLSVDGGFPERLPFPMGAGLSFSPDGSELAYMPLQRADQIWKRYRGGRATSVWIAKTSDSSVIPIPRKDSNDYAPMWIGSNVYFLSDRNGPVTLFRYDTRTKQVAQALENKGLDVKWASAGPDAIAYEQFGSIHVYDLKSGKTQPVNVTLNGDLPEVRPRMERAQRWIMSSGISPTGVRALFEARGDIFTVPVEKGDVRNLTSTPGVAERYPSWSPDGKSIAYFSDESGEYELHIRAQNGLGEVTKIALGKPGSFYYAPLWSPDSKKIAYIDKRLSVWYIDLEKKTPVKIDTGTYNGSNYKLDPAWSHDSKWIAYAKELRNHLCAVHVYSLDSGKATQITDGMSDARFPQFDRNGKHLYFAASTDAGPSQNGIDMSTYNRPQTYNVYVTVLRKEDPSPLAPESDEEKVTEEKSDDGRYR